MKFKVRNGKPVYIFPEYTPTLYTFSEIYLRPSPQKQHNTIKQARIYALNKTKPQINAGFINCVSDKLKLT